MMGSNDQTMVTSNDCHLAEYCLEPSYPQARFALKPEALHISSVFLVMRLTVLPTATRKLWSWEGSVRVLGLSAVPGSVVTRPSLALAPCNVQYLVTRDASFSGAGTDVELGHAVRMWLWLVTRHIRPISRACHRNFPRLQKSM